MAKYNVDVKVRGDDYTLVGDSVEVIVEKANKITDNKLNLTVAEVLAQGMWSSIYRKDYAKSHPRTSEGKPKAPRKTV